MGKKHMAILILLLMGCSFFVGLVMGSEGAWDDIKEAVGRVSSPAGELVPNSDNPDLSTLDKVYVTAVIDGDTIDVLFSDGTEERVRMVGIDTPESHGDNDPSKWNGIDDAIVLDRWGKTAKAESEEVLFGSFVYLDYDEVSGERGYYGRLLAYVVLPSGVTYNAYLVQEGLARVYLSADFELMDLYMGYEQSAQSEGHGVWGQADYSEKDGVRIDTLNPFSESVVISNYTDSAVDMSLWSLHDEAQKTFVFPFGFTLQPNRSVTIYSYDGFNSLLALYWGNDSNVWNNDSDTATLVDRQGTIVDVFSY